MAFKTTDKILTIDKDAKLRLEINTYLEDGGFLVLEAENGEQGLELFRREKPDLVLIELQMTGLSGEKVLEKITEESPQTPTVVMAEVSNMSSIIEALKHGASDYILKPVADMTVLEHAIAKSLERSRLVEMNRIYREKLEQTNQALKKSLDILEQDQAAGRSVQMRMLPEQDIQYGSYHFSHGVEPSLYLSGDFLDYFKINDNELGVYIADVSGHGASSAFVTVLLKSLISLALTRYQIHNDTTILEPDKMLAALSREIYNAKLGKYLTIVYGVLNWTTHEFVYSIGGHFPPPILLENGKAKYLDGKSFPVGIMKEAKYQKATLKMPENSQLVMFSDGITEILSETDLQAKELAILSMVEKGNGTIDYFREVLGLQEKRGLPDDVTMLILRRE